MEEASTVEGCKNITHTHTHTHTNTHTHTHTHTHRGTKLSTKGILGVVYVTRCQVQWRFQTDYIEFASTLI